LAGFVVGTGEGASAFSVYREMELYVQAGFSPMDALRAATVVPAKGMGRDQDPGTVEVEKNCRPAVLDANPLEKISNIRSVRLVMKWGAFRECGVVEGRWVCAIDGMQRLRVRSAE